MYRFLIILLFVFASMATVGSAQVIDLDEEKELIEPEKFKKSTMFYISPADFGYQLGTISIHDLIESSFELNPRRLTRFVGFGVGWRRKAIHYNFYGAFQPFTTPLVKTAGNLRTIADFSKVFFEFTIGHEVFSTDRQNIILKGGLGVFGNTVQLRQYTTSTFDMNDFTSGQGTAWPLMEHYSGTFDIALELAMKPIRPLSVLASIQLGYKGSIGSPNWLSPDASLINTISDRVDVIYLRTSLLISRQY